MKRRDVDLFYRPMPSDAEAERMTLCALLLAADGPGHPAFAELEPQDFCLGRLGFNAWLFGKIRSGRQSRRQSTIAYLLRRKHRRQAAEMGVANLPAAIGTLLLAADRRYAPGWVSRLTEYVARLKSIRTLRRAIWDAEEGYRRAWRAWDDHERQA